jgi:hypothetical protein
MSFDAQAFRVTLEEERLMGIADPGSASCMFPRSNDVEVVPFEILSYWSLFAAFAVAIVLELLVLAHVVCVLQMMVVRPVLHSLMMTCARKRASAGKTLTKRRHDKLHCRLKL